MNWLDIVIVCLAGIGIVKGLFDGIIKQVVSLIALLAGIFLCGMAAAWLRDYIVDLNWLPPGGVTILSYVLGFFLIVGIVLLAGQIVHKLIGATPLSVVNHFFGGVFGFLLMIFFLSLCFNLIELIDTGSVLIKMQAKMDSRFYYPLKELIPTIFPGNLFAIGD